MAVRRIISCMLVVGIAALGGFGVMQGIAQTEPAVLRPDQLKPTNYGSPKSAATPMAAPKIELPPLDALDPVIPPAPDMLPVLGPTVEMKMAPMPVIKTPPTTSMKAETSAMTIPTVETSVKPDPMSTVQTPRETLKNPLTTTAGPRVAPTIALETIAPETAPFGMPVAYEIVVKNVGQVAVSHVRVDEEIGPGTKFIGAEPAAELSGDKAMWMLGSLNPGEEKHIKVTVKPGEGDLVTKPRVSYTTSTVMNVKITRPNLTITVNMPEVAQVGDEVPMQIQIANNGTGEASKILLKAILADGLKHPEGNDIQALLNKLAPGESQTVTLRVQAAVPGVQNCVLTATAEGSAKAQTQSKLDVRQPKLTLVMAGPVKCMVKAEPTFTLEISNPGTSATEPVQVAAAFPEGLDFGTASDGGAYDPATRTVSWNLGATAAGSKRSLTVKAKSNVAGHLAVRAVAQAGPKLNTRAEAVIQAEGVPALMFDVVDLEDPIEVGRETTYEIRVGNNGTMHCTNVKITAALSEGLIPGQVTASMPYKLVGQTLVFEPIPKMSVKSDLIIRVKAKGMTPGDHRFKVQLSCDQIRQPVVKEESTSFFQQ